MYVEVKKFGLDTTAAREYVYIKHDVHEGKKVKPVTVECLGSLESFTKYDPDIIAKLSAICKQGSSEIFSTKIRLAEARMQDCLKMQIATGASSLKFAEEEDGNCSPAHTAFNFLDQGGGNIESDKDESIHARQFLESLFNPPRIEVSAKMRQLLEDTYLGLNDIPEHGPDLHEGLCDAVVVAAGVGKRMGAMIPKQYLKLDHKCVLEHTVLKLLSSPYVSRVIVVLSKDDPYFKHTCLGTLQRVVTVCGGKERVDSVLNGLKAAQSPWVLVHDAARPLVFLSDIEKLVLSVAVAHSHFGYSGGILCAKEANTLKKAYAHVPALLPDTTVVLDKLQAEESLIANHVYEGLSTRSSTSASAGAAGAAGQELLNLASVDCTIDRSLMYAAQTPQLFLRSELLSAIEQAQSAGFALTDEASALEYVGKKVLLLVGSELNFKLTTPSDLLLMQAVIRAFSEER